MKNLNGKKILVVEDDEFLGKLYTDLLKNAHASVDLASDGKTAFDQMRKGGYDLVLLDIVLPQMNGTDVIALLKKEQPAALEQRIIFLTNLDKTEMVHEVKKLGFSYLIKSDLNPQEFLNRVGENL